MNLMKLMIIDGNSIANRGFYGVRPLNAPDGTPTNAIFGFLNIFMRLMGEVKPDAVAITFDVHEPTFRHKAFDFYKAQRKPMPDDLRTQMPILQQVLEDMGLKIYTCPGYEADDLLGTAGSICAASGWECCIVTGDRDSLQLVTDSTSVCLIKSKAGQTETTFYTPAVFQAEYGFSPIRLIDLKALMGDSSDNIPGVPGIGEKTAMDLIHRFGSLDGIYASLNSPEIKNGARKKLAEGEQSGRDSYWLATIKCDVPFEFDPKDCLWHYDYKPELYDLFIRLGFSKFITKWGIGRNYAPAFVTEEASDENENPFVSASAAAKPAVINVSDENAAEFAANCKKAEQIAFLVNSECSEVQVFDGNDTYLMTRTACMTEFDATLDVLLASDIKKVTADLKGVLRTLYEHGFKAEGFVFDVSLAGYLLNSLASDYSVRTMAIAYLGREADGVSAIYDLVAPMQEKLEALGLTELYTTAELPLCEVLADMEITGFYVDRQALYEYGKNLTTVIDALEKSIHDLAGEKFNINSPKQLGAILFDKLELPYYKKTKTGFSTNADVLEKNRPFHPIIDQVLDYRMLTKLKSTYADGLLKVIDADGRVHTNFQMTVTATGRLSSTEPNLQNIPVRKELGAQIRKMFTAGEGNVLVDADYSQIELRLLAHMADDDRMVEAFTSGHDFHTVTAANVFRVPVEEVTPAMRSSAKAVNFGIVYGMKAFTLAQDIGVTVGEAQSYMDAYFEEYSSVKAYLDAVVKAAQIDGYVKTLYGRRREIPELHYPKQPMREFGKRVALNMPVQGTAADIMKLAMIEAYRNLRSSGLKAKLVLQVHDELIVECPEAEADAVKKILHDSMADIAHLRVPLEVEVNAGHSWAEAH